MIERVQVATAISKLEDPFTCYNILDELGVEKNEDNHEEVMRILHHFKQRKWITNSVNNLYFRSMREFRF
jgi:hypothetical protein